MSKRALVHILHCNVMWWCLPHTLLADNPLSIWQDTYHHIFFCDLASTNFRQEPYVIQGRSVGVRHI